jgi:hypothetical protein
MAVVCCLLVISPIVLDYVDWSTLIISALNPFFFLSFPFTLIMRVLYPSNMA